MRLPGLLLEADIIRVDNLTRNWQVRQPAYELLSAQGPAAIEDLVCGLKHPSSNVRWWCAQLLDHAANNACVPALLDLLYDPCRACAAWLFMH